MRLSFIKRSSPGFIGGYYILCIIGYSVFLLWFEIWINSNVPEGMNSGFCVITIHYRSSLITLLHYDCTDNCSVRAFSWNIEITEHHKWFNIENIAFQRCLILWQSIELKPFNKMGYQIKGSGFGITRTKRSTVTWKKLKFSTPSIRSVLKKSKPCIFRAMLNSRQKL